MHPSINNVNVTMASVRALSTGRRLATDRRRTVVRARTGERMKREQRSEMMVLGCTDDDLSLSPSTPTLLLKSSTAAATAVTGFFTNDPARTKTAAGRYATPNVLRAPKIGASGAPALKNKLLNKGFEPMTIPIIDPTTGGLNTDLTWVTTFDTKLAFSSCTVASFKPSTFLPRVQNKGDQIKR